MGVLSLIGKVIRKVPPGGLIMKTTGKLPGGKVLSMGMGKKRKRQGPKLHFDDLQPGWRESLLMEESELGDEVKLRRSTLLGE